MINRTHILVIIEIIIKSKHIKAVLVGLFLCMGIQTNAQFKFTDNLKTMVNYHFGYNLPEYPFLITLTEDYVRSLDVCIFKETIGKNSWEQIYHYPEYGISLFYSSLGNDDILGRELALTYFFKVFLVSKNRFRLFNRVGLGIGYVNRKFDLKENYLNVAAGSHFNIHFNLRLGANYILSDNFEINTGISLDHFSNGNTSEPNLGINYLTAFAGLSYRFGERYEKQKIELPPHLKKNYMSLFLSIGGKHPRSLTSKYYLTSSVSFEITRPFSRIFHLGLGADLFYDSSVESSFIEKGEEYKKVYDFQSGIHLSPSLIYNRIRLTIQVGVYLFLTEQVDNYSIYNRGIIQYKINERFSIRLAMKSHLHILDYPEIGLGYKF